MEGCSDGSISHAENAIETDVEALIAMVDYILPEVGKISLIATVLMHLARSELVTIRECRNGNVLAFRPN